MISFRVGTTDAEDLAHQFDHTFASSQFTELELYQILIKKIQDGRPTEPFRATALPPLGNLYGRKDKLVARSREKYARRRAEVESKLNRWLTG
jgi:hypothetical protein